MNNQSNQTIDITPRLNDSASLKNLKVAINGILIREEDILEIQINYEDSIKGKLTFIDDINILEESGSSVGLVDIFFTDSLGNDTSLNFLIVDMEVVRIKNNQLNVIITLEEINFHILKNTYFSKTFKNKTKQEIFKSLINDSKFKGNLFIDDGKEKIESFVTPSNISLWEFLKRESKISNIKIFSDREGLVIIDRDKLDPQNLRESQPKDFSFVDFNDFPFWNVLEYDGYLGRNFITKDAPKVNIHHTNVEDLRYNAKISTREESYNKTKINGYAGLGENVKIYDVEIGDGTKQISLPFKNDLFGDERDIRDILLEQQKIRIAVPGIGTNKSHTKVKMNLLRPGGHSASNSGDRNDTVFSGYFIITKVVDKIIRGKFTQFLTLQAPDYGKGLK